MTEPSEDVPPGAKKGSDFEARLSQAQDRQRAKSARSKASADGTAMGIGMRLSAELVVATVIGGGLGYAFDWALGTSPWFLIAMVLLGAAAGIRNMLRATDEMTRAQQEAAHRGAVEDEDRSGGDGPQAEVKGQEDSGG